MIEQSTNSVVMIRPSRFYPNPETAADNSFQREASGENVATMSKTAQDEFDRAVETLGTAGVSVHVFEDTVAPDKPDAVFPNNWFSTHHDGRVALYPMFSPARRRERRTDIFDELRRSFRISEVIDYSKYEEQGQCLEGTGSLVLDHAQKIAYVSLSQRAHLEPLERFCTDFGYEAVNFTSLGEDGRPIYHTNVIMCVGSEFALLALEMIPEAKERERVRDRLASTGKEIIELTRKQIGEFTGNAIELHGDAGKLLVMSSRGVAALDAAQRKLIQRYARLVPLSLPTIELAGGSARCMIATIHLPPL